MKTILIVDDEPDIVLTTELFLKLNGYEVVSAADGEQGWKLVQTSPPALIITAWMMPRMDGIKFCRLLKRDPNYGSIPVTSHPPLVFQAHLLPKTGAVFVGL